MIILIPFLIVPIAIVLACIWVSGIDYMKTKHPDYKGEDFLE